MHTGKRHALATASKLRDADNLVCEVRSPAFMRGKVAEPHERGTQTRVKIPTGPIVSAKILQQTELSALLP